MDLRSFNVYSYESFFLCSDSACKLKSQENKGKIGSCWSLNLDAESQLTSSSYDKNTSMASSLPSWLHKYKEDRIFEVICAPVQIYIHFIS
jgi:hypothetical protein